MRGSLQGLVVRGKSWAQVESDPGKAARRHRFRGQHAFMDSLVSFTPTAAMTFEKFSQSYRMEFSALLASSLPPPNVHLLTLEEWKDGGVLLRLEHFFDKDEDEELSKPVRFSISDLFSAFEITDVREVILGANLDAGQLDRLEWKAERDNEVDWNDGCGGGDETIRTEEESPTTVITLNPMQIRSFVVKLAPRD